MYFQSSMRSAEHNNNETEVDEMHLDKTQQAVLSLTSVELF